MTYNTAKEQLEALRAPFDPKQIKTRVQQGVELSYYPSHVIHNRLLDVLGSGLGMTTERVEVSDDRIDMCVRLSIHWLGDIYSEVDGWGSADILRSKTTGKIVSDSFKSAYTDALKVAASKLGVGLELYDKDYLKTLGASIAGDDSEDDHVKPKKPAPEAEAPKAGPGLSRFKRNTKAADNE